MQVLSDVEKPLEISQSVVSHEFGVLWNHFTLASGDNASIVVEKLSRFCFACWLLALIVSLIVDHKKLLQEQVHSIHHILIWECSLTLQADKT
jgi:hypothetical protein